MTKRASTRRATTTSTTSGRRDLNPRPPEPHLCAGASLGSPTQDNRPYYRDTDCPDVTLTATTTHGIATKVGSKIGSTPTLLAIDPGLDASGWAAYHIPPARTLTTLAGARPLYRHSGTIRTAPGRPDEERLVAIACAVDDLCHTYAPTVVVVEVPATDGSYARARRQATSTEGFIKHTIKHVHRVIGVALAVAAHHGATVRFLRAKGKKRTAHALLSTSWPDLGRTNEDQRDAIVLGYRAIMS